MNILLIASVITGVIGLTCVIKPELIRYFRNYHHEAWGFNANLDHPFQSLTFFRVIGALVIVLASFMGYLGSMSNSGNRGKHMEVVECEIHGTSMFSIPEGVNPDTYRENFVTCPDCEKDNRPND